MSKYKPTGRPPGRPRKDGRPAGSVPKVPPRCSTPTTTPAAGKAPSSTAATTNAAAGESSAPPSAALPTGAGRLATLIALRDHLAARIPLVYDREAAPLAARLLEVLVQIDELDPPTPKAKPDTPLSEFERALAARRRTA